MLKVEFLKASPPVHCGVVCVGVRLVTRRTPTQTTAECTVLYVHMYKTRMPRVFFFFLILCRFKFAGKIMLWVLNFCENNLPHKTCTLHYFNTYTNQLRALFICDFSLRQTPTLLSDIHSPSSGSTKCVYQHITVQCFSVTSLDGRTNDTSFNFWHQSRVFCCWIVVSFVGKVFV